MPYKGTDFEAYKKAGQKGKTAEQKSEIYYKEKKKNEIKRGILGVFSLSNKSCTRISKDRQTRYSPKENILDYIRKQRSSKLVSNAANSFSIVMVKSFGKKLTNKEKDFVRSSMALVISETVNKALERPLKVIDNIEMFIKVGKVLYKIILKLNKYTKEYELDQNNIFEVNETNNEYQSFLIEYPKLKNKYGLVNSQFELKECPLCNSKLELIIEENQEFYVCSNYLKGNYKYKVIKE